MIANNDYNEGKYKFRYFVMKYLPEYFYAYVLNYFYKKKFGRSINLNNPKSLSEKILWSSLYDKNPMKTIVSDKLKAKEYVSRIIPNLKSAKVYQVSNNFENIDLSLAPKTFVIKTNHAWKSNILIDDKNKITADYYESLIKYYKNVLSINYAYWGTPELQYKNIKPKIFLEEYLHSKNKESFIGEYQVYCFNGKPEFLGYSVTYTGTYLDYDNENYTEEQIMKVKFYDSNWEKANFKIRFSNDLADCNSVNKNLVLYYAEILATGFDFVRIDIFEVDEVLYFGEFTFSPYSGFIEFYPDEYDFIFGEKLKIRKI